MQMIPLLPEACLMGWEYTITIDKKFIITLFLVATVLGGGLALIYWDLKTSLDTLKSSYAEMEDNYGAVSAQLGLFKA